MLLALTVSVVAAGGAAEQVELRGSEVAPGGAVVRVEKGGLGVGEPMVWIGWDRVKRVEGGGAGEAGAFLAAGERAWRARARLERGDTYAAEPLFEELFSVFRGSRGPTAAVVSEGLLRCRLRRGALAGAVPAWLGLMESRAGGTAGWYRAAWAQEVGLGTVVDEGTGLVPGLPPVWVDVAAVRVFAGGESGSSELDWLVDDDARELARLYVRAARFEVGLKTEGEVGVGGSAGVALVRDVVSARTSAAEAERGAARERLMKRLEAAEVPEWVEAWCRLGVGVSLARESSRDDRRRGVLELLKVPARMGESQRYASGLALAFAAVELWRLGDVDAARVIARELNEDYAGHPALDWSLVREAGGAGGAGSVVESEGKR